MVPIRNVAPMVDDENEIFDVNDDDPMFEDPSASWRRPQQPQLSNKEGGSLTVQVYQKCWCATCNSIIFVPLESGIHEHYCLGASVLFTIIPRTFLDYCAPKTYASLLSSFSPLFFSLIQAVADLWL